MFKLTQGIRSTVSGAMVALVTSLSFAPATFAGTDGISQNSKAVAADRLQSAIAYENQFKTVGSLINELAALGAMTQAEKKGIENFLASRHFDLETKISQGSINANTVRWGSVGLTWLANGDVKTQAGRVVHSAAADSQDKIFIDTFNAMMGKEVSSTWTRLLLPTAKAQSPLDILGSVLGGLARVVTSIAAVVAIPVCGIPAMAMDAALNQIRRAIWNGKVECLGGRYAITGYEGFFRQTGQDYRYAQAATPGVTLSRSLDAAAFAVCAAPLGRLIPGSPYSRARYHEVDPRVLSQIFRGPIPACSDDSAKYVGRTIRHHAERIEQSLMGSGSRPHSPRDMPQNSRSEYNPMIQ